MRKFLIGLAIVACSAEAHAINFTISGANAAPGGTAEFAVNIYGVEAGGALVNNAQLDILFDTSVFYVPADPRRACQIAPQLAQLTHTETLPISPPAPSGMQRLRLNVIDTIAPLGDITEGGFYFCVLEVREDAPSGATTLTGTRQNVGDTAGNILSTTVGSAAIMISGSGGGNALQPRGGGGVPGAPPAALDIPANEPAAAGNRPAQPVEGNKSGSGIGTVAQGIPPEPAAGTQATPPAREGLAADTGDTRAAADKAAGATPVLAGQGATPNTTVSPKATAVATVAVTITKAATPNGTATQAAKKTATPEKEEKSSGACAMGQPNSIGGAALPIVACVAAWLFRRRRGL